ncbi:hypothetical protein JCM31271_30340 [Halorubrum trueperi]
MYGGPGDDHDAVLALVRDVFRFLCGRCRGARGVCDGLARIGFVFLYLFLIAFALPGPDETVLAVPLDLTLPG